MKSRVSSPVPVMTSGSSCSAPDEVRNDVAIRSGHLAGSERIEEAAAHRAHAREEIVAVELPERLRDLIGGVEIEADRHVLPDRRVDAMSGDRATRRGVHDAAGT